MTTEAEVRVIPLLEGGHKTRNTGNIKKLERTRSYICPKRPQKGM